MFGTTIYVDHDSYNFFFRLVHAYYDRSKCKNGLFEINLLKFHRYGQTKWEQLGKTYEYADKGGMTQERMIELQKMYLDEGIAAYIGDDTPF